MISVKEVPEDECKACFERIGVHIKKSILMGKDGPYSFCRVCDLLDHMTCYCHHPNGKMGIAGS